MYASSSLHVSDVRTPAPPSRHHPFEKSQPSIPFLPKTLPRARSNDQAKQLHAYILKSGFQPNISFFNSLIHCYASNGSLFDAQRLFDEVPQRDVVSWTTLVGGYARLGKMCDARKLFDEMPEKNGVSWNVMIQGYGKNGDVEDARRLFDEMPQRDVVSWNSLISAYARNGLSEEAFTIFQELMIAGVVPSKASFLGVLPAVAVLGHDLHGMCVHSLILKMGIELDSTVSSALIDMYSKCGFLEMALRVFDTNQQKSVASWNPMLAGLVRNNRFQEVLELFRAMQFEKIEPDYVTMVTILPAIAYFGALGIGKWVHAYIERSKIRMSATLASALVDMYSKCGCIEIALQVFNSTADKTVELYNAMISGLAVHGHGRAAIALFSQMQASHLKFDDITLAAVLSACSHSGFVDEGLQIFAAMKDEYKMTPKIQHYGCVVDLLGRAGMLEEAKQLIENMPIEPDVIIWKSLLGSCKTHGNVEIGELAARHLIKSYPNDSSSYIMMSNLYGAAGHSNDAVALRKMMNNGRIRKEPGFSTIELGGVVHEFLVGDKSHPNVEEVYAMLDEMGQKLKSVGHVPNTKLVLFDIDEEGKETALHHHSEKLAVAFGLINSSPGEPIHVVKNLRMCSDCHIVIKLLSKIYDREIVVRDHRRFHHFRNGSCSCKDYW